MKPINFNNEDLEGTIQSHDDALVITAWIGGFLVKRVMIDQGSRAYVMYLDLFKGLGLKDQDLTKYDSPLVSFDGRQGGDGDVHSGQLVLFIQWGPSRPLCI